MRYLVTIIFLSLVTGCSSYEPPTPRMVEKSTVIEASAEAVWDAVVRYFAERNIPIENMDHSSFFIKTQPVNLSHVHGGGKIPLKNAWCDCGTPKLRNVWSTTHHIFFAFNILLDGRAPKATAATINVFFNGKKLGKRNLYAPGYDVEVPLQCISTGKFEQDLLAYLIRAST